MERRYTVGQFWALNNVWLRIAQTQATGDGAPAAATPAGRSSSARVRQRRRSKSASRSPATFECFATNVDYRIDTPQARAFLSQFVTLP
jgi:hypothetical protein